MKLFADCYCRLQHRRGWLLLILLLLLVVAGGTFPQLKVEESISAMLPDGDSQVARDFQLLQRAPFARKLVIHLTAADGIESDRLIAATDQLRSALPAELFSNPLSGPAELATSQLFRQLGDYLPYLADVKDLRAVDAQLTPERIDTRLAEDLAQLLQPQGVALKKQIQRDPLQLDRLALQKLRYLNPIPGVRLERGHFISQDGRSSLILSDTPVAITDAVGGRALLDAFAAARQNLPAGISADLVSGHPYTLANADAIQGDMQRVLLVSIIGILLLFFLFLRSLRALSVYLLPLLSMVVAVLVTAAWFGTLSGITLGFGAVLLGITIDFALHVYFALRNGSGVETREQLLQAVSRPVLFGGLTTLAAFAVLLRSELPGQRQLAVFAMAGIIAALLLALLFLPHFIGAREEESPLSRRQLRRHIYDRAPALRLTVLLLWLLVAGFAGWQAQKLTINGELRQLSYLPIELQQAEQRLSESWGNMRGRALLFATATDLESALRLNELVWRRLGEQGLQEDSVSLAPLFPSQKAQQLRLQNWDDFWQQRRATTQDLLQASGQKYGFSAAAFDPFWTRLDKTPAVIDRQLIESLGLGRMLDNLLLVDEQGYQLMTLVPDQPEVISLLEEKLARLPGCRWFRRVASVSSSVLRSALILAASSVLRGSPCCCCCCCCFGVCRKYCWRCCRC